ncbi:hypothetical protein ACRAQ7_10875 [Erythrobacter sp. W53]|uniref:hypothetical protein n=1 Tax=Erythrobacter sp. W53 TaxID=3425947 RepID=UPI003D768F85
MRENNRVDVDLVASTPYRTAAKDLTADQKSQLRDEVENYRQCVGGNVVYDQSKQEMRVSVRNQTQGQLKTRLSCFEGPEGLIDVNLTQEQGWLSDRFKLELNMWFDDFVDPDTQRLRILYPKLLSFEFPTEGSVELMSASDALTVNFDESGGANWVVTFETNEPIHQSMIRARDYKNDCEGEKLNRRCPIKEPYYSNVKLIAYYDKSNVSLNEVIAFLSLLFGSGLVISWLSRKSNATSGKQYRD